VKGATLAANAITRVLRIHQFRWLLIGLFASNLGAQISFVTATTHLFTLSESNAVVGLLGAVTLVPMLALGLVGGVFADRMGRRRIVLGGQLIAALAAGALALSVWVTGGSVLEVLAFAAVWAATIALSSPARISLIPLVVPKSELSAANSSLTLIMTLTWIVGPLTAAILVSVAGFEAAYGADAALGVLAFLAFARLNEAETRLSQESKARLRDGIHLVGRTPSVLLALTLDVIAMVLCSPRVLFPAAATAVLLGGDVTTVGLLFASLAAGATVGSVLPGRRRWSDPGSQSRSLVAMTITWGGAVTAFGLVLMVNPAPPAALAAACAAMAVAGGADARATVVRQTTIQTVMDSAHMGRIQGLVFVIGVAGPRLGDSLMGGLAEVTSVSRAAILGGLACVLTAALASLSLRARLRNPPDSAPNEAQMNRAGSENSAS